MKRTRLFDACSLLAYLNDEVGADRVEELLGDSECTRVVHVINLLEVYYDVYRVEGSAKAQEVLSLLQEFPVHIVTSIKPETFREAGRLKATIASLLPMLLRWERLAFRMPSL
jgi:PIN domain nuclease of toxin-antitoxin system